MTTTRRKNTPRTKPKVDPETETVGADEQAEGEAVVPETAEPETVDEEAAVEVKEDEPEASTPVEGKSHTVTVKSSAFSYRGGSLNVVAFKGDTIEVNDEVYERGIALGAIAD